MDLHAGKYRLTDQAGQVQADQSCQVALDEAGVTILPAAGAKLFLYYSDIDQVSDADHAIELLHFDGNRYTLYFLGTWFGQCKADLRRLRGAQLTRNLLMLDGAPVKEFQGAYTFEAPDGRRHADKACKITLYTSSLVVEPQQEDFWSLAYADVQQIRFDPEEYCLRISTDLDEQVTFRMLGNRFGELEREIGLLIEAIYQRTGALLKERLPASVSSDVVGRLARLLRQGKAVPQQQVAALGAWSELEAIMFTPAGRAEPEGARQAAFAHLCGLAEPQNVFVALRESFESNHPVFWFVIAFPEAGKLVVEVTNEPGNATYVYRFQGPLERAVAELCRAMVAVNFRRDVISASEQELASERMARYRVALRKLPYVRSLRERFAGRAAHSSDEGWQRRMAALLEQ